MNEPSRTNAFEEISLQQTHLISGDIALEVFKEVIEPYYTNLTVDIARYQELVADNACFLDYKMIRNLEYRLRFCAHKADVFLKEFGKTGNKDVSVLISDAAWKLQLIAEKHLDALFTQASLGMKYFPKTFEAIERIDPSKFRKGASIEVRRQIVGEILELAGIERNLAVRKLTPRLKKESVEYYQETAYLTGNVIDGISKNIDKLASESSKKTSINFGNPTNILIANYSGKTPMIYADYSSLGPTLNILLKSHQSKIYHVLEDFIGEENELQMRLRNGLGLRHMYRSADFDNWFLPELPDTYE